MGADSLRYFRRCGLKRTAWEQQPFPGMSGGGGGPYIGGLVGGGGPYIGGLGGGGGGPKGRPSCTLSQT